jgi:hypothetical protein
VGDRVSVEEKVAVVEADEESNERDENASDEEWVGFAGDDRAHGFGIAGNPDGSLADGAGAGALTAQDNFARFGLAEFGVASI